MIPITFSAKSLDLLKETVIILSITILTFVIGMSYALLSQYNILVFFALFVTILGLSWIIAGQKSKVPLKPQILLWLVSYIISVLLSIDTRRSLSQMFLMLIGVFLFLLTYELVSRGWKINYFMKAYIIVGLVFILISANETIRWYINWISINPGKWIPDFSYRLSTNNLIPPFLFLSFHMSLPFLFKSRNKLISIVIGMIMFLGMVALYMSSSRGGWLGMFFGLWIWAFYLIKTYKDKINTTIQKIQKRKVLLYSLLFLLFSILTIGGIFLYIQANHPSHGTRSLVWSVAINSFLKYPIFGQGPYTYGTAYLNTISAPPTTLIPHGHNIYLNLLGEMGIFGFLTASIFMVGYFNKFRKIYLQSKEKLILISILAFIISCAVHNLFDSYHTKPAMIWPLCILAGAAIAPKTELKQSDLFKRPWWILIIISFSWFGIWTITPYSQAIELIMLNKWEKSFEKLQLAITRDPHNGLIHQQIGIVSSKLAADGNTEMVDNAIIAFESAIKYEPGWALNYANLSNLYLIKGNFEKAEFYARTAYLQASKSSLYALNLSEVFRLTGNLNQSKQAYNLMIKLAPSWDTPDLRKKYDFSTPYYIDWYLFFPEYDYPTIEQLQIEINNKPHQSRFFNQLAKIQIDNGDIDNATQSLENAYFRNHNVNIDGIETEWLWAELLAKSSNFQEAVEKGSNAFDRYFDYGLYGPSRFGELQYAPNIFRMTANPLEIIPQMVKPPTPEIWLERKELLNEWKVLSK